MTAAQFKKWQKQMSLSNPQAALQLAVTERMITYYRSGQQVIGAFGKEQYGRSLFIPAADKKEEDLLQ